MPALLVASAFLASVAAPFVIERALHRWGSARLARFAFVAVGTRRLSRVNERLDSSDRTYRGGTMRREVLLPVGAWTLAGPNRGTVRVEVQPSRRGAFVRMTVPKGTQEGQRVQVTATMRVTIARDGDGWALRARALPEGLAFALGLPVGAVWAAILWSRPSLVLGGAVVAVVVTAFFQAQWWLLHGGLVRESAAIALAAVAGEVESEAAPTRLPG